MDFLCKGPLVLGLNVALVRASRTMSVGVSGADDRLGPCMRCFFPNQKCLVFTCIPAQVETKHVPAATG